MKVYFLSSQPCALRLNGVFFGVTDTFERFAEVALNDNIFIEFIPEGRQPVAFFLSENIRFTPPKGCEVYLLKDGVAIYARDFPPTDFALRTVAQAREGDHLATLFCQGEVQLTIERGKELFVATLPPSFASSELFFAEELVFLRTETQLAVYTEKAELCLLEKVLSYSIEKGGLRAALPLSDSGNRIADCAWLLSERGCEQTEFTLRVREDGVQTPAELLPYAFFESVLIGADFAQFLSDELAPEADKIRAFLGEFVSVIVTEQNNTCGLVKKKAERLYEVAYFTVKIENDKISDVTT